MKVSSRNQGNGGHLVWNGACRHEDMSDTHVEILPRASGEGIMVGTEEEQEVLERTASCLSPRPGKIAAGLDTTEG